MTYDTIAPDAAPSERLTCIERDGNLRHTGARWLAHEAAYPGLGALGMLNRERDAKTLAEYTRARDEFRARTPADDPARVYLEWLVAELEAALAAYPS